MPHFSGVGCSQAVNMDPERKGQFLSIVKYVKLHCVIFSSFFFLETFTLKEHGKNDYDYSSSILLNTLWIR